MKKLIIVFILISLKCTGQKTTQEDWRLSTEKSYISYEGRHILHEWSGITKKIKGVLIMKNNEPLKTAIISKVRDFDSGNSSRDSHALEILESLLFPDVSFFGDSISVNDKTFNISGKLKFHSIEKRINVSGLWNATNEEILLKGKFEIKPSDFEIDLPDFMLVKMENKLDIDYEIVFAKK
tara:strand:+ start:1316 stop:1858 length:543 start_codon:yes stop_codon:yes gene_type:complete